MNLAKLMQQAQKLQEAQAGLSDRTCSATDASGKVTVVASAAGEIKSLEIDPTIVSSDDVEFLQDIILNTANTALKDAREDAAKDMAANLNIPGMG
ncbi:MAG: YbaB/EbfC family nucleoid-associated protein [Verrucomicrobiota bacterium JB023]|nr:YbaB/EbfC family nucleoid-associated protein [Verrucomicrobiota bacterium JB023]